jgi:hypothetical protein
MPISILLRRLQNFRYPRVEFHLALLVTLLLAYSWAVRDRLAYALVHMPPLRIRLLQLVV